MSIDIERLRASLRRLGLHTMADTFEREAQKAAKAKQSYVGFLAHLVDDELAAKADRSIDARIARARFLAVRTLEAFDFAFQPSIPAPLIRELAELGFLDRAENLLFLGPPGVGKTHLAVALGLEAIQRGFGVYFVTAHALVEDLRQAYAEHRLERRLRIYVAPKLLIIDEIGYLPLEPMGATVLFQLISARYERGSIILTSNKSYGDWGTIFGDPIIATAILDRLLHHSTTVNIRGDSYRLKERKKSQIAALASGASGGVSAASPGPDKEAQHGLGENSAGLDKQGRSGGRRRFRSQRKSGGTSTQEIRRKSGKHEAKAGSWTG